MSGAYLLASATWPILARAALVEAPAQQSRHRLSPGRAGAGYPGAVRCAVAGGACPRSLPLFSSRNDQLVQIPIRFHDLDAAISVPVAGSPAAT